MSLTEWADDLAYTLKKSGHGMEQITLASVEDPKSDELVLDTARRTAALAGWPVIEISAEDLRRAEPLPRHGYLRGVPAPRGPARRAGPYGRRFLGRRLASWVAGVGATAEPVDAGEPAEGWAGAGVRGLAGAGAW